MSTGPDRAARLPPRWFVRAAWLIHRALYSGTGGRLGLRSATADRWGMMRLRTIGRRTGEERTAILGYFEDGPDLVTMAMNGWADPEPAWWLNLPGASGRDGRPCRWAARRPRARRGRGRAATTVGPVGGLRQGSRRLRRPEVTRDPGRHPGATARTAFRGPPSRLSRTASAPWRMRPGGAVRHWWSWATRRMLPMPSLSRSQAARQWRWRGWFAVP